MDKSTEKYIVKKIQKEFGRYLDRYGFIHSKPTLFVRLHALYADVIQLHKYSFQSSFRVHTAIRRFSDSFSAIHLNGPDSHEWKIRSRKELRFDENQAQINTCLSDLAEFYTAVCEPFFCDAAIGGKNQHQNEDGRQETIELSMKLLGIKTICNNSEKSQ